MKRNIITFILALLLGVLVYWLYLKNDRGTIDADVRNFAISDPTAIEKITLKKNQEQVVLVRKGDGSWELNGNYTANADKVKALFYVLKNVDIKQPVKKSEQASVLHTLVSNGILCELYSQGNVVKSYYVSNNIHGGTAMVLVDLDENKPVEKAFITYVAGVDEDIAANYFTDEKSWRDNTVFSYSTEQIQSVKLQVPLMPPADYELSIDGKGKYQVKMLSSGQLLSNLDEASVKQYLSYFSQLNFERFETDFSEADRDKLLKSTPLNIITVTDKSGKSNTVRFYPLKNLRNIKDKDGKSLDIDPERMLALLNNQKDVVIVKYFEFGKVMPPAVYFQFK